MYIVPQPDLQDSHSRPWRALGWAATLSALAASTRDARCPMRSGVARRSTAGAPLFASASPPETVLFQMRLE